LSARADLLVAQTVILAVKAIPGLPPAHEAQSQTYLRMTGLSVGLLKNFHTTRLKDGLKRFVASWHHFLRGPLRPSRCLRVGNGGRVHGLAGATDPRPGLALDGGQPRIEIRLPSLNVLSLYISRKPRVTVIVAR
jgi:hypothetical protein